MKLRISQKIPLFFSTFSIFIFIIFSILVFNSVQTNFISNIKNPSSEIIERTSFQIGNLINGYINELTLLSRERVFQSNDWNLIKNELDYLADKMNPDFEM